jgi:hypothetical protein
MANANRPRGFEPKGKILRVNEYMSSAACYKGDLLTLQTSGKVAPATAGSLVVGVCLSYVSATDLKVSVADHPDQLIIGQVAASEIDAQTDLFNTADITATAGDTTYGESRQVIDGASQSASGTAQLRLLQVEGRPNNALGQYVAVICSINEHAYGPAQANAGIGV